MKPPDFFVPWECNFCDPPTKFATFSFTMTQCGKGDLGGSYLRVFRVTNSDIR